MQSLLNHPRLMDCRRLFLRDYEVWINIGVHDFEKKGEQRVAINVDLYVPLAETTPQADRLDEVRSLTDEVVEVVEVAFGSGAAVIANLAWLLPLAGYRHDTYAPVLVHETSYTMVAG